MSINSPNFRFPRQRLSYKQKIADDFQWGKDMIDHLCLYYQTNLSSNYYPEDTGRSSYQRKLANYLLYNNILDQKDFERDCNALGISVGQFQDEIKPYNKIPNKIQVLLGEEMLRPFNFRPILVNSEGIRTKQAGMTESLRQAIMRGVEELIQLLKSRYVNQNPQMSEDEMMQIEQEIQSKVGSLVDQSDLEALNHTSYLDAREIMASRILEYLLHAQSIREKMNDAFKHGLISGEEFAWVGIRNGEPVVDILNPLGVFYDKSPEVKYIQDGMYAGYRTMMNTSDILDRYGEYLLNDDIEKLEGTLQGINGARKDLVGPKMKYHNVDLFYEYQSKMMDHSYEEGSYGKSSYGDHWLVTHVEWKSERKVYFIKYVNEYGDEVTEIASEDFVIPDNAVKQTVTKKYGKKETIYSYQNYTIREGWISEVWEGTRIGDNIYCCIGPKENQYRDPDNPRVIRLGYHGLVYNNMNADSVSLLDRMRGFQYLYFLVAHKLKQMIAKDKGQVFHLDTSMIPEELGLEKTLYYLEFLDIDFFNPLQNAEMPGAYQRGKVSGATNRSNMQHIMNYIQVLDALDYQISDVAGITRQREGQTPNNQAVTNAQQDLQQSSTVTEAVYFNPHFGLWREILGSLLQCAQAAWKNKSVKKQYVLDDLSLRTLDMTPETMNNSVFGVFISNSTRDNEVFETLKQLTQPLLQNDKAKMSDIIKLVKANSVQSLEQQVIQSEKSFEKQQQQQIEAQQQMQQQQLAIQRELQEDQQAHETQLKQMELEAQILMKQMDIQSKSAQADTDKDNPNSLEVAKFKADVAFKNKQLELQNKKIETDARLKEKQIAKQAARPKSS